MVRVSLLSLPVVAVLIGALTMGVVVLGRYLDLGVYGLLLLAVPIAVAVAYLVWYSRLPYEPPAPRARPASMAAPAGPVPDEPFEDPVEEADRFDSAAAAQAPPSDQGADEPDEPPPESS